MTPHELMRLAATPLLPIVYSRVHRDLRRLLREQTNAAGARLLDVGGRKSPYTIGLPARITILDRPRTSDLQERLHLGLTPEMVARFQRRRSNLECWRSWTEAAWVVYGVRTGKHRVRGLRSMSLRRPARLLGTILSNQINRIESLGLDHQPRRTAHLFAVARGRR